MKKKRKKNKLGLSCAKLRASLGLLGFDLLLVLLRLTSMDWIYQFDFGAVISLIGKFGQKMFVKNVLKAS